MEINFFTDENMGLFWDYLKMLLKAVSPMILIVFATLAVGMVITIVVSIFRKSSNDDDDDDIEIKHY